ncbi:MAG TPA: Tad domain-containing protein [Verrucomicrobiae bacterium]|nr:Tad domain-containing protein [Verrucomicrobiae bacterium]
MIANSRRNHRQRGNTMVLFALMLPTLICPLVGLAIDGTVTYAVQAKLSAAVDGAALGAGRLLGTQADPSEIAGEFLAANFQTGVKGFWGANNLIKTITYTPGTTKTIKVDARVDVPLLFLRVIGKTKATVSAAATATRRDSRMVFVIDRSGSMNQTQTDGNTAIVDLKSYAQGFTQKFTPGTDEVGLVVFDGASVVGYPTTRPWDSTTTSTSTGGPDTSFLSQGGTSCCDMVWQIKAINAGGATGMADALSVAYIELQKAHLRDLAANGVDTRMNSIVLFTDGIPTSLTMDLNNSGWNDIASSSTCSNKSKWPSPKMMGWMAVAGNPPFGNTTLPDTTYWPRLLPTTDPSSSHTANWYMGNGASDATYPNPTTPFSGCSGLPGSSSGNSSSALADITGIPTNDAYGNAINITKYTDSEILDSSGNVVSPNPLYNGTALDLTKKTSSYHWGLAIWNAVYSAANNIRNDSNLANRTGDTQNMSVAIYTIGYLGNGGVDRGLLRDVANDKSAPSYNSAQASGMFVSAADPTGLADAFNVVASAILRLAY